MSEDETKRLRNISEAASRPRSTSGESRLLVVSGPFAGRTYELEEELLIGRGRECDVRLEETAISRTHARLHRTTSGGWEIEDLGSRNGTWVNGQQVERCDLSFGDRIEVGGRTILLFTHDYPIEEQLRRRQRLEAIGELSAGVAHDFNNLLGAVIASVDYLRGLSAKHALSEEDVQECLADIHSAASRGAELTARLLDLARRGRSVDESLDATRLCEEVVQLAKRTFPRSITVRADVEKGLTLVGSYTQLYHSLLNLCINARDAMPRGGELTVTARRQYDSGRQAGAGEHVEITVTDTGIGMDQATQDRAFEPFFTTKDGVAGSGLGLPSVLGTVRGHGGRLELSSLPGEGTTFRMVLPKRDYDPPRTPPRAPRDALSRTPSGPSASVAPRVLLVDDDAVLRRSLGRVLRRGGFDVAFAEDGEAGVRAFADASPKPDVVLLDLDMPRLGGAEAFVRMRDEEPGVRVVMMSGISTQEQRAELLAGGVVAFLQKPLQMSELVRTLKRAVLSD